MNKILNQIRSSNSVFASASLPVSANTQGTYLNQVYIGMFRPDGNALPRWVGNLKQYKFIYDVASDSLQLADSANAPAVSPTSVSSTRRQRASGLIRPASGRTFETATSGKYSRSDAPDGEKVEKGGIAQTLRETHYSGASGRLVFTCPGSSLR